MTHSSGYLKWVKSQLWLQLSKKLLKLFVMELTMGKDKEEICEDLKVKKYLRGVLTHSSKLFWFSGPFGLYKPQGGNSWRKSGK